ncbi:MULTISPECIES: aspartate kinase [Bacillus]|uniref:Aspartokinase n=1 Tax=Bacillus pseudomycoides TaxID=64104 RepID=A0A1Y3MGX6_9BACI|nr:MULTISPECIES: aspartate kinase [Bacillus cereus group]EOP55556.1 aspartate kinase, monofunctional class [Bacillus cereus VD136]EOP74102.1 aspartate kinase, monofunctional class [Bacillus cereus VDM006]EOQ11201.1 aspartate kinase, monofunctional class [Bacillus cereus VDM021]OOG91804.1 Aspartokinase [Bacillus mycoides]MDF2086819.1 aspartate kinase [Bacillus pseudomycoides]
METIVQKFGGTSVGSIQRIQHVADLIIEEYGQGHSVVSVVSAMGKSTDELVALATAITENPSKREMDMLLTTGEQVTISLLTMALQTKGYNAISLTGWQAGITTESVHSSARITDIHTERIQSHLQEGTIVIVAGFQGLSEENEITTLGRGGSDTTAVALAAALKAKKCDIYTDVTGVYTTDPRVVNSAYKLNEISYDEMLELANLGAGVLHPRAVEFAKNHNVVLEVRSSMEQENGTIVRGECNMEQQSIVKGIAFEDNITRVTIKGLEQGVLSTVFSTLATAHINVDIIIQSITNEGTVHLSFSIHSGDLRETLEVLEQNQEALHYESVEYENHLAKVSIVGSGMVSNPGVAADMFSTLKDENIHIKMVSTSEIKISVVIDRLHLVDGVEALHQAFMAKIEPLVQMN